MDAAKTVGLSRQKLPKFWTKEIKDMMEDLGTQ